MKKVTLLICLINLLYGFSQSAPIDFEAGGNGATWTWTVFENDTNPDLEIISNPDPTGINTSQTVAKFTALQSGQPWAGCESAQGADLGEFVLDETNSTISIMVWKDVISDVGIKLVSSTFWSQGEIKVPNTVINEWEKITFDFSNFTNPPAGNGVLNQIVIFPDFDLGGRTQDNVVYFDNITFDDGALSVSNNEFSNNLVIYPNPASENWTILNKNTEITSASLYDLNGKLVTFIDQVYQQNLTLDASMLKTGIYFATVVTEKSTKTLKLIKQ